MSFIGIITDSRSQEKMQAILDQSFFKRGNEIIWIKESNIENIKNITFDTIVVNKKFEKIDRLIQLLQKVKYLVMNMDIGNDIKVESQGEISIITYGFHPKSTITASSVEEERALLCLQRTVTSKYGKRVNPQEIRIEVGKDITIYDQMIVLSLWVIYLK